MKNFNSIKVSMVVLIALFLQSCTAQIKNAKITHVKIFGNCEMCKENIETAALVKGIAKAEWNTDSKMGVLTFDSTKTSEDEILKRIAYAGYDNPNYLAPEEAYSKLHSCCQYDRAVAEKSDTPVVKTSAQKDSISAIGQVKTVPVMTNVYAAYFELKDALVTDNAPAASVKAQLFLKAIAEEPMGSMPADAHAVWMKALKSLNTNAQKIADNKDIEVQRTAFSAMSTAMFNVAVSFKSDIMMYYQHCPMYNDGKGADWLSKENAVKNPYYGASMLTCGKTTEIIKK